MRRSLPDSVDDLRGLRAARWIRVSTDEQADNYGPDSQRQQQDDAIERHGLLDTGLTWDALGVSGYATDAAGVARLASDPRYQDMLNRAGREYDVLLVAYVSRLGRDAEMLLMTRRLLHNAGAVIFACDERLLSNDPYWLRETVSSQEFSDRLSKRIAEGYESKWRRHSDPAGHAPLGYRRTDRKPFLLQVDPDTIGQATELYQRYSRGNVSIDQLAEARIARKRSEVPMTREGIADVLSNPIYRGETAHKGESAERPDLRAIEDDLWFRVQEVMALRTSGGGPHKGSKRVDLLGGVLYCVCGTRVRSDGYNATRRPRKRHPMKRSETGEKLPCEHWGHAERLYASTWELPIVQQVSSLDLSERTMHRIRLALAAPPSRPDEGGRKRIERERRLLREAFEAGRVDAPTFIAKSASLDQQSKASAEAAPRRDRPSPEQASRYLRNLADTWAKADEPERADFVHAIYGRIEVAGSSFAGVRLTPAAEAHGLALALPEQVTVTEQAFDPSCGIGVPERAEAREVGPCTDSRTRRVGVRRR